MTTPREHLLDSCPVPGGCIRCWCLTPAEIEAQREEGLGDAAMANGLVLKARAHYRVAAAYRRTVGGES